MQILNIITAVILPFYCSTVVANAIVGILHICIISTIYRQYIKYS